MESLNRVSGSKNRSSLSRDLAPRNRNFVPPLAAPPPDKQGTPPAKNIALETELNVRWLETALTSENNEAKH